MNASARAVPLVHRVHFAGENWLHFPALHPDVAINRAATADEKGNLTFEHEGATLGAMEMALSARKSGGLVTAQVKRVAERSSLRPHDVKVPGILVDVIVQAPDPLQTTATAYDPANLGELFRPLSSFRLPEFNASKVIARRVAQELQAGWAVNIGFGISANVPRILLEEGRHGEVTWVIEQGAVGGIPLLDFKFGCSSNAEAFVASHTSSAIFRLAALTARCCRFSRLTRMGRSTSAACRPLRTAAGPGGVSTSLRGLERSSFPAISMRGQRCTSKMANSLSTRRGAWRSSWKRSIRSASRAGAHARSGRTSPIPPNAA